MKRIIIVAALMLVGAGSASGQAVDLGGGSASEVPGTYEILDERYILFFSGRNRDRALALRLPLEGIDTTNLAQTGTFHVELKEVHEDPTVSGVPVARIWQGPAADLLTSEHHRMTAMIVPIVKESARFIIIFNGKTLVQLARHLKWPAALLWASHRDKRKQEQISEPPNQGPAEVQPPARSRSPEGVPADR